VMTGVVLPLANVHVAALDPHDPQLVAPVDDV